MRATVVDDEEDRERLWALADCVFPAYASYRRDAAEAHRTIPIVQLSRKAPATADWLGSKRRHVLVVPADRTLSVGSSL